MENEWTEWTPPLQTDNGNDDEGITDYFIKAFLIIVAVLFILGVIIEICVDKGLVRFPQIRQKRPGSPSDRTDLVVSWGPRTETEIDRTVDLEHRKVIYSFDDPHHYSINLKLPRDSLVTMNDRWQQNIASFEIRSLLPKDRDDKPPPQDPQTPSPLPSNDNGSNKLHRPNPNLSTPKSSSIFGNNVYYSLDQKTLQTVLNYTTTPTRRRGHINEVSSCLNHSTIVEKHYRVRNGTLASPSPQKYTQCTRTSENSRVQAASNLKQLLERPRPVPRSLPLLSPKYYQSN